MVISVVLFFTQPVSRLAKASAATNRIVFFLIVLSDYYSTLLTSKSVAENH